MAIFTKATPFNLPELHEAILLHLPPRDLLLATRVNRQWKALITRNDLEVETTPLLQDLFPPIFTNIFTLAHDVDELDYDDDDAHWALLKQSWYSAEQRRKAVLRPEASWRRMFATNPPARLEDLDIDYVGCCFCIKQFRGKLGDVYGEKLGSDPGPRMGLIWDVITFVLDDNPSGSLCLRWEREWTGRLGTDGKEEIFWGLNMVA
ncbi:hypothetical protein BJY04DRAFT_223732 [Aspergillus karnatakaensis]|uniref:F-box protein n=1 Tax=Aspergillus karnatakaensis TaxID=1810916 RepID=UPI003CCCC54A